MLIYYDVALPVPLEKYFSYRCSESIKPGCRVLVSLGNSFHTGVVWQESAQCEKEYEYKDILEIIDDEPKISANLRQLAEWISRYYQCSVGLVLAAMLPSAFNVQLQQKIKLNTGKHIPDSDGTPELIINKLSAVEWLNIADLKAELNIKPTDFNHWLERLENLGIVDIERVSDARIKKKIANFVLPKRLKEIPALTDKQQEAWTIISGHKQPFPLSKIVEDVSRSILKTLENKGLLSIEAREIREEYFRMPAKCEPKKIELTGEQKLAIEEISIFIREEKFQPFLLFGITGSGKTEVYIEVIKNCLQKEKTALMLVPEISLTPQMVERFFHAFGQDIAILHSHLNDRERWQQWNKINSGECRIVIGARSAIFAPLKNIGIIIVDEEHETTYKQDNAPRYNGRDIAIVRAQMSNAVVVLGSATPSLESWHNAQESKYQLLQLTRRPVDFKLPTVKIIDMCRESDHKTLISKELRDKISEKLAAHEQIILFQNRRGHSSFVQCISCGNLFTCPRCEISLNFHSHFQQLICHYCGHTLAMPRQCPDCGGFLFQFGAAGTQQVESQLQILFPKARILRMDSDSAKRKDSYDSMFERMRNGYVDILLGTQMIAKGLDFANVTLVGVILADISLNVPDFRAAERTFQLLTQVAGRSGRGEKPGEVIIQTYNPQHYAIQQATQQDFVAFANKELILRKAFKYPPGFRLARFLFSHATEKYLKEQVQKNIGVVDKLRAANDDKMLKILGPTPAPLVKLQNSYRYHLILKADSVQLLSRAVFYLKENLKLSSSIKMSVDVDPYGLM